MGDSTPLCPHALTGDLANPGVPPTLGESCPYNGSVFSSRTHPAPPRSRSGAPWVRLLEPERRPLARRSNASRRRLGACAVARAPLARTSGEPRAPLAQAPLARSSGSNAACAQLARRIARGPHATARALPGAYPHPNDVQPGTLASMCAVAQTHLRGRTLGGLDSHLLVVCLPACSARLHQASAKCGGSARLPHVARLEVVPLLDALQPQTCFVPPC